LPVAYSVRDGALIMGNAPLAWQVPDTPRKIVAMSMKRRERWLDLGIAAGRSRIRRAR
jgi:hypothetical protein